jgi:hypothetical protein
VFPSSSLHEAAVKLTNAINAIFLKFFNIFINI